MIIRFLTGLFFLYLLPGNAYVFGTGLAALASTQPLWLPLAGGFALGWVGYRVLVSRIAGFDTFEHELTHALVALLFLRPVTGFRVTRHEGGWVSYGGGLGGAFANDMIGLAPYFLPTFTVVPAIVYPWIPAEWSLGVLVAMGATLAYHTFSTLAETRQSWTSTSFIRAGTSELAHSDIAQSGHLYSAVTIASVALGLHAAIWWIVVDGYAGFAAAWQDAWRISGASWHWLGEWLAVGWHALRDLVGSIV